MEYYKTVEIKDNSNNSVIFSCTSKATENENENYLIGTEGWDTYAGTQHTTVPKLLGSGSYLSNTHHSERELTLSASLYDENEIELIAKKDILAHTQLSEKLVTITTNYYEVSADRTQETLRRTEWFEECLISASPGWDQLDAEVLLTISLLALNPEKNYTEVLNGVTTTGTIL